MRSTFIAFLDGSRPGRCVLLITENGSFKNTESSFWSFFILVGEWGLVRVIDGLMDYRVGVDVGCVFGSRVLFIGLYKQIMVHFTFNGLYKQIMAHLIFVSTFV
jgi:hypothetical protein